MFRKFAGKGYLALQKFLHSRGWQLARVQPEPGEHLNVIPYMLSYWIGKGEQGYLVQVGANNGVRADPVFDSIREFSLPALLIEPLPEEFAELCKNYSDAGNRVILENCAVGPREGTAKLYRVKPKFARTYPEYVAGIASFDRSVLLKAEKHIPGLAGQIEALDVPVYPLASLLEKHGIENVLMLQVDTEGYDFEVVKLALAAGIAPRIINYEYKHLSAGDQRQCRGMLAKHSYSFVNLGKEDTLAVREG